MRKFLMALVCIVFFVFPLVWSSHVFAVSDFEVVTNGIAKAVIRYESNADAQTVKVANTLKEYILKSTGVELQITPGQGTGPGIYVGTSAAVDQARINNLLACLDNEGYIIDVNADNIAIIGPTAWGTEFGVYEFLEKYFGVRWLMPGPDGEHVPQYSSVAVPFGMQREEPVTKSRQFFEYHTTAWDNWQAFNRIHERYKYHHNMHKLFDPAVFGSSHPEFYPGGIVPTGGDDWQPCFSDPDTITAAISRINDYFATHPQAESYSLGINDSDNFCEADPNHPSYPGPILNSIGELNMSDIYYAWVNAVVAGVLQTYPDKYFGLLAYSNVYDPPTFDLNSHVIVYITDDRMAWSDSTVEVAQKQHALDWEAKATQLGWYDYLYGSPYLVPRVYNTRMANNYLYATQHKVVGHTAELFPNFGEGPKPWLSARLQWNPDQDVDALMGEWCVAAVGAASAPYLKQYYDLWEDFWTVRIFQTEWYTNWKNSSPRSNFLRFDNADYLGAVTSNDLAQSNNLMNLVVQNAATDQQKKRANLLMLAFRYYEASVLSYTPKGPIAAPANTAEALDLLQKTIVSMDSADYRLNYLNQFKGGDPLLGLKGDPVLGQSMRIANQWFGMTSGTFTALINWISGEPDNGAVRDRLIQLANDSPSQKIRDYARFLYAAGTNKPQLLNNPSFEVGGADPDTSPSWGYWGTNARSTDYARNGQYSLKVSGLNPGGPYQNFSIQPGRYGVLYRFFSPVGSLTDSWARVGLTLFDSSGNALSTIYSDETIVKHYTGNWTTVEMVAVVPEKVNGVNVSSAQINPIFWEMGSQTNVYIDDAAVYVLDQPIVTNQKVVNGSFETAGTGEILAPPWNYWGTAARSNTFSRTGKYSACVDGVNPGGLYQNFEITPGRYQAKFFFYSPLSTEQTSSWTRLGITLYDAQGTALNSIYSDATYVQVNSGKGWTTVEATFDVLPSYDGKIPVSVQISPIFWDLAPGMKVYVEDVSLFPLLLSNESFEVAGANGTLAPPWNYWGTMTRTDTVSKTGQYSLELSGVNPGGTVQNIAVTPGKYHAKFYFYTPPGIATGSWTRLGVTVYDSKGTNLGDIYSDAVYVQGHIGTWAVVETNFEVLSEYNGKIPASVQVGPVFWELGTGRGVYIDDVQLFKY